MNPMRFRAKVLEDFNEHYVFDDVIFASHKTKQAAERKMGIKVQRPEDAHTNSFPDLMETFVGVERVVPTRSELPDSLGLAPAFIYTCKDVECNKAEGRTLIFNARRIENQWYTTSCLVCTELKSKRCDIVNVQLEQRPRARTSAKEKRKAADDDNDHHVAKRPTTRSVRADMSESEDEPEEEETKAAAVTNPALHGSPYTPGRNSFAVQNGRGPRPAPNRGHTTIDTPERVYASVNPGLTAVAAELEIKKMEIDLLRKDRQARDETIKSLQAQLEEKTAENRELRKDRQQATDALKAQVADLRKDKDEATEALKAQVDDLRKAKEAADKKLSHLRRSDGDPKSKSSSDRHADALDKAVEAKDKTIDILESQLKAANDKIDELEQAAVGTSLRRITKAVADLNARFDLVRNDQADQISLLINAQRDIKMRLGLGGDDKIAALEDSIDEIREKLGMEGKVVL